MRRRQFVGLAVVAGFGSGRRPDLLEELAAPSVLQEDPRFQEIGRLISSRMAEHRIPGVGFGLFKNGRSALRGFGLTNLDNPQPVTPDSTWATVPRRAVGESSPVNRSNGCGCRGFARTAPRTRSESPGTSAVSTAC